MFKTIPQAVFFVKTIVQLGFAATAVSEFLGGNTTGAFLLFGMAVLLRIEANTASKV